MGNDNAEIVDSFTCIGSVMEVDIGSITYVRTGLTKIERIILQAETNRGHQTKQ